MVASVESMLQVYDGEKESRHDKATLTTITKAKLKAYFEGDIVSVKYNEDGFNGYKKATIIGKIVGFTPCTIILDTSTPYNAMEKEIEIKNIVEINNVNVENVLVRARLEE